MTALLQFWHCHTFNIVNDHSQNVTFRPWIWPSVRCIHRLHPFSIIIVSTNSLKMFSKEGNYWGGCAFFCIYWFFAQYYSKETFFKEQMETIYHTFIPQCSKNLKKCGLGKTYYLLHQRLKNDIFWKKNSNVPNTHPKCACLAKTKFQKKLT